MVDFVMISTRYKKETVEIYPKWVVIKSSDLMIRGGDFYSVWLEKSQRWSTDEGDLIRLIDEELRKYYEEYRSTHEGTSIRVLYMWDAESGMIDSWHRYCQRQLRDNFHTLDEKLVFANAEACKEDYSSKSLPYSLGPGDISAYDRLMSVLYSPEERHKLEWAVGSIVCGESKTLQKFIVLYGSQGSGKSTFLNIIQQLFEGYYTVFDAKALGSTNSAFALEPFAKNPLVAIQHDGDLSHIEDNTRLNSLVSHELMVVNEKFKNTYASTFKCFLFMGTNKPVKITDAKSGLIRRLIDVSPTGDKIPMKEYTQLITEIGFELGAIANHCMEVYKENPSYYDGYIPISMLGASNDFYNFIMDSYVVFNRENSTTLKSAWEMYKVYCEDARVAYPYSQRLFKEELKNYFDEFRDRATLDDGTRVRNYYYGFKRDKFEEIDENIPENPIELIDFVYDESILDNILASYPAQYSNKDGIPSKKWSDVTTKLSDLDTKQEHYVKMPENHIVIDFDIKKDGEKDFQLNLEAASKWPKTYAELSKSGKGIHLHYIYTGDVSQLSKVADENVEIKVFTGNSSLRRRVSKCNNLPIASISSGLPVKGDKMINSKIIENEKQLRIMIRKNLNKEIHPNTKPSIDFISKLLDDAYKSGMPYDVEDLHHSVLLFAMNSTNQAEYCLKQVSKMKFKSENASNFIDPGEVPIVFYDIEVFPNLFVVCWSFDGDGQAINGLINPTISQIEDLIKYRLIGFNCRRYDNHVLYAAMMGYTNEQLYALSQKIIKDGKGFFSEAYNLSYTDIYDFANGDNKTSLKKLEIKMGIHHQELGLPWDEPVDEKLWPTVMDYCKNDVFATRAAFKYLNSDWTARQILADLAGKSVNDTTNTLTAKFIFEGNRTPQNEFCYRDLSQPVALLTPEVEEFLREACPEMMAAPHGEANSILPYFPGYTFDHGKSIYKGQEVGEGGWVYANHGVYGNVALLDIASMHPHTVIAECLFGPYYTRRWRNIVNARVGIKHSDWDSIDPQLRTQMDKYITKVQNGEITAKNLANSIKIPINSAYGLTAASFENPFRDPRNIDNIVAKRGALFMVDLVEYVQSLGYTVVHIKTDSIKIADADDDIIQKVYGFGKRYGYTFEHEATYEKLCLVNNAVYVAKDAKDGHWTATGTQFQVPYVFKQLFTHEPIQFDDLCEVKSVSSEMYLDMNENIPSDEHNYVFIGKVGNFCPMKPGSGGGVLLRKTNTGDFAAVTGTKGYRWMESEVVKATGKMSDIDTSYYQKLVDGAYTAIFEYTNVEWFCGDDPYTGTIPLGLPF